MQIFQNFINVKKRYEASLKCFATVRKTRKSKFIITTNNLNILDCTTATLA